jgi:iron complex transport system substrate-binding protein
MRIITLIASATETVCALGLREFLVGRSHECDYPESVTELPICTRPRFEVTGSSRQIDERVKSLARESVVKDALGVYEVFPEKLRELQPTHIVTQAQCEVCAVNLRDVEIAVQKVADCEATIISLQPNNMVDFWASLCTAASHLGTTSAGVQLVANLQSRMERIESEVRPLPLAARPSVACIEWVDPLMAAGNWTPELIHMAGGDNLFGEPGNHSPWMSFDELRQKNPDAIVIAPCGFDLARTRQDLPLLQAQPGWNELRAVRDGRVYLADGNQYFNRPGPRLAETLEILAEILHPDRFEFGHEGATWERVGSPLQA